MDAQSQSENHHPKTMIVHRGSSQKIVHNCINDLQRQKLNSILCAIKENFSLNLLSEEIPVLQFNVIHLGESHREREGKTQIM